MAFQNRVKCALKEGADHFQSNFATLSGSVRLCSRITKTEKTDESVRSELASKTVDQTTDIGPVLLLMVRRNSSVSLLTNQAKNFWKT